MNELSRMKKLNNEFRKIEVNRTSDRVNEIQSFDQMLKEDKRKRQDMYKQMLSSQIQYNKGLKAYGNMTEIEKSMNKNNLQTYSSFGSSPSKKEAVKSSLNAPFEGARRSQDAYGYGRYLQKVPTAGPIEKYNKPAGQLNRDANSFSQDNRSFTGNMPGVQKPNNYRDLSAAPHSRRHQHSSRGNPSERSLRNAGVISMNQEQRPAGSPSAVYQYRQNIL